MPRIAGEDGFLNRKLVTNLGLIPPKPASNAEKYILYWEVTELAEMHSLYGLYSLHIHFHRVFSAFLCFLLPLVAEFLLLIWALHSFLGDLQVT